MGIPWAEIGAEESMYEGGEAWKITDPLPATRHHPHVPEWTCPDCRQKAVERRNREEAEAKQREFERLNHTKVYADRMVDYYFSDGLKYRDIFEVLRVVENGQVTRAVLRSERRGNLCRIEGALTKETLDSFVALAKEEVGHMQKVDTILDQVMPWREWRPGKEMAARNLRNFPFRYYWSRDNNAWRRVAEKPALPSVPPPLLSHSDIFEFGKYPCIWCGQVTDDWYHYDGQGHCRCNDCDRKQRKALSKTS
ncbi:hypothetical protein EON80_26085 [bacterium]|nr:MAG: hypothetical protein EON80_26085 [bacterium]